MKTDEEKRRQKLQIYAERKLLIPHSRFSGDIVDDRYDPVCNWPYNGRCRMFPSSTARLDDEKNWNRMHELWHRAIEQEWEYHDTIQRTHGRRLKGA